MHGRSELQQIQRTGRTRVDFDRQRQLHRHRRRHWTPRLEDGHLTAGRSNCDIRRLRLADSQNNRREAGDAHGHSVLGLHLGFIL